MALESRTPCLAGDSFPLGVTGKVQAQVPSFRNFYIRQRNNRNERNDNFDDQVYKETGPGYCGRSLVALKYQETTTYIKFPIGAGQILASHVSEEEIKWKLGMEMAGVKKGSTKD